MIAVFSPDLKTEFGFARPCATRRNRINIRSPLSRGCGGEAFVPRLDSVIGFHPSIRFVVTSGKHGNILDAVKRRKVVSLEPSDEMRSITERYAILYGLTQSSNDYFGKPSAIVVLREKLVEMIFPSLTGWSSSAPS